MLKRLSPVWMVIVISSVAGGCAALAPPPSTAPSPTAPAVTAPINKANDASKSVEETAKEREQLNPEASGLPSPVPSPQ